VLSQCDNCAALSSDVESELLQTSAAVVAATAADNDDDILYKGYTSQEDTYTDNVERNMTDSVSEANAQDHTSESQNLDLEKPDNECQTFCQQYRISDDDRSEILQKQCQQLGPDDQLEQHADLQCQHSNVRIQCPLVLDVHCVPSGQEHKNVDEQRESTDRQNHENVDRECQTLYEEDSIETETKDVQCQTTHGVSQLSSRQVQTDETSTTVAEAATETDNDDVHHWQQAATTCDEQPTQVLTCYVIVHTNINETHRLDARANDIWHW